MVYRSLAGNILTISEYSVERTLDTGVLVTGALTSNAISGGEGGLCIQPRKQGKKQETKLIYS